MRADLAQKRMREFVWYHIHGDGDCNGQTLRAYAEAARFNAQDRFDLAYFYATTYCCVSAVYLLQHRNDITADPAAFAEAHRQKLIFQSDRKYVRMRDTFKRMLAEWSQSITHQQREFATATVANAGTVDTEKALKWVLNWYFFSRFSAYLFVETYCDITAQEATRANGLNYEGDSMTFAGGACYVYGLDTDAQYIQKNHRLPFDSEFFESMIRGIQERVKRAGGDDSLVKLETSLCAYEKFFKGTRYNGYYADRMLGEIQTMKRVPEFAQACQDVLSARSRAIADKYLGERHGWDGIRKELKKSYQRTQRITASGK